MCAGMAFHAVMLQMIPNWWRQPSCYRVVRWLFPRLLAVVYAIAFMSWDAQCDGLVGERGILPAGEYLKQVHAFEAREGKNLFPQMPGFFYWHYSDSFQHWVCRGGVAAAVLVGAGVLQGPLLLLLWFAYLSVAGVGNIFMGYQWDALLLEAGLLGLFIAPWRLWSPRASGDAPAGAVWLLHWLLFRLMWLSGYVKIGGQDDVWLNNTALKYYYETQPLPNPLSWWAHNLPEWAHVWSCKVMFGIELWLPFAIFLGRWGRLAACAGFTLFMGAILLTGNYNFFNLLTIALALTLLDDSWWPQRVRAWLAVPDEPRLRWDRWHAPVYAAAAGLTFFSLVAADAFLAGRVKDYRAKAPAWGTEIYREHFASWRSINAYGLFQDMTTERNEIVIEVSADGGDWKEVQFPWKPNAIAERPRQCAPHQPRLDWQMWFAALYPGYEPQRDADPRSPVFWFGHFMAALLEGRDEVWRLAGEPPIDKSKIAHIRAQFYRYRFTSPEERRATGAFWKRELAGQYSPVFSKRGGSPP